MKKLREIRTKIDAYIQTHKPAAFIMWLLVLLFPLWLSLSGNAISFLSGEDGAAVLLCRERLLRQEIPFDLHDYPIPWVITEAGLFEDGTPARPE